MKSHLKILAISLACAAFSLTACGGGGSGSVQPPAITVQIFSDPAYDGDIQQTPTSYVVTQGMSATVQSIFAGIDPLNLTEYRAFLDFPLNGAGGVPANAVIESAFLDIFVNSFQPTTASLPILIELVSFQPPSLLATDFDRTVQPPLGYIRVSPPFVVSDVGTNVSIDVTSLMVIAQQKGLVDFQVRIMEDLGPAIPGLLEIADPTGANRPQQAPELTVTYF